ncbi:uncharacterized protein LOC119096668 [Pollicipes pollicipes]|uniref:uncharacterized protein LOC119096668 n=1 Tax=Pollicipes pollicipes TaxID=41117 RepID=UPI0018852276|nr:uncharacterized protein LOC119096668 [Pollicipes pollicipes]
MVLRPAMAAGPGRSARPGPRSRADGSLSAMVEAAGHLWLEGSLCPACVAHSMDCPNGGIAGFGGGCGGGGSGDSVTNGSITSGHSRHGRIAGEPPSEALSRSTILTKAKPFPVMAGDQMVSCLTQHMGRTGTDPAR